jgi:SAM-dependent methyltransferase
MKTYEPQYQWQIDLMEKHGHVIMGITSGSTYLTDPKRLVFLLSRYKFASKIIQGKDNVLEIGCGDGFGSQLLTQTVEHYTGIDIDQVFIADAVSRFSDDARKTFICHDILAEALPDGKFQSAVSLDVLEHIPASREDQYFLNVSRAMSRDAIFVVGMPSLESQPYASGGGAGHINCKSGEDLRKLTQQYFENALLFSMNDEVVHTGYVKMAHYIICIGIHPLK